MKNWIARIVNALFAHCKIAENKMIFETGGYKPGDNPLAIYRYIKKNCPDRYRTIWFVKKGLDCADVDPKDIVYYRTWRYFYHLATAHFWIRSHSVGSLLKKREGQIYIQTWHGGGAFKKCGYDIDEAVDRPPVDHVKEWDYFIASDPYNASMIQTAYGYQKEVRILGLPRSDSIVNASNEKIAELKKRILPQIHPDQKVLLYAPTFRDVEQKQKKVHLPIEQLAALSQYTILIRLHPYVRSYLDPKILSDQMVDVSLYPNVEDLLLISDCLITDYSSIIFDYGLLKRPMIFYTYDYEDYMKERTGFYLNYEKDLPGIRIESQTELVNYLKEADDLNAAGEHLLSCFNEKYNTMNDGHVCERVLAFIESL